MNACAILPPLVKHVARLCLVSCLLVVMMMGTPAFAQSADWWEMGFGPMGLGASLGSPFGIAPWGSDTWQNGNVSRITPASSGIFLQLYREHSESWAGETGFYAGWYFRTPISPGGSRTWLDFYLWSQNFTPGPTNLVHIGPDHEFPKPPPAGYMGHLVLEQVPIGYSGPMYYWLDLNQSYDLALPIPIVTDPLQGTRFHLTVYAPPIPEPNSFAALALGLLPLGAALAKRRKG